MHTHRAKSTIFSLRDGKQEGHRPVRSSFCVCVCVCVCVRIRTYVLAPDMPSIGGPKLVHFSLITGDGGRRESEMPFKISKFCRPTLTGHNKHENKNLLRQLFLECNKQIATVFSFRIDGDN